MKKLLYAATLIVLTAALLSACGKKSGDAQGKSLTIQEWLDSKGGSEGDTLTVKITSIENPMWAVVEDSSNATVHLYGVMINGELEGFEEAGLSVGDTIVISSGQYNEFEGTVEIKEASLIEVK